MSKSFSPFSAVARRASPLTPDEVRSLNDFHTSSISAAGPIGPNLLQWFTGPGGEDHTFNLISDLAQVQYPTLVMGGEEDPMTPIECQADIAAALPPHLVCFERFAACGHAVVPDAPEPALALIRKFIIGSEP